MSNKVYRAGTIPYVIDEDGIKMLFMRPSDPKYGGNMLQIAKGKVESNEDNQTAALREAKEELGLFIGNVVSTHELGNFLGRTTIYVAELKPNSLFGEPSFETSETKWLTLEQFMEEGRDLHKPIVQAAVRLIQRLKQTNVNK